MIFSESEMILFILNLSTRLDNLCKFILMSFLRQLPFKVRQQQFVKQTNRFINIKMKSKFQIKTLTNQQNSKRSSKSSQKTGLGLSKNKFKNSSNKQKNFVCAKSPPSLKRQNTEESFQAIKKSQSIKKDGQFLLSVNREKSYRKAQKDSVKIQSDEESTNIYRYNKQSADQQQDPYNISLKNRFVKEKSIKPSRDVSIRLMCNSQQPKISQNEAQRTDIYQTSPKPLQSITELKSSIKKKLRTYKSLAKMHQQQNQYFEKSVKISKQEQNRLNKIHEIEINIIKGEIFQLRDQIDRCLKN